MAQFIKRISEYFDGQVVTFVLDSLRKRVHSIRDCLLISDSRSLAGIVNEGSFDCVTSIAALNDYVHLNKDLTKIHMLLNSRGVFIGYVETSEQYAQHVHSRHNYILAQFMILLSFVFGRVIPRLFGARQIIEKCGLVKHHGLTKCEALGRLRYCGFQIMRLREFGKRLYFLARKSSAPLNGAPCEGMLIKIRKVGLKGNIIQCYKLRTMHSYANYLHDYILDNLEIDNNGKVVGDFRVPTWGKILRKLWLDEMPQLLNILKGELTFIGLRHLSQEFLQLYPEDWRNERMKLRPGFVPPYYADCPKTFEDIIESEKRYYYLKKKYPITTDVYYFIRVVISFLTMKARTG